MRNIAISIGILIGIGGIAFIVYKMNQKPPVQNKKEIISQIKKELSFTKDDAIQTRPDSDFIELSYEELQKFLSLVKKYKDAGSEGKFRTDNPSDYKVFVMYVKRIISPK